MDADHVLSDLEDRFGPAWPPVTGHSGLDVTIDPQTAPWTDLDARAIMHGTVERIAFLPQGTKRGRASVALLVRCDDGTVVVGETTYRLYAAAARAIAAAPSAQAEPTT